MARERKDAAPKRTGLPADYAAFLGALKSRVRQAQTKAMFSVNQELIQLYWDIGRRIVEWQDQEGWGKSANPPRHRGRERSKIGGLRRRGVAQT